jgi:hypothetical protein
MHPVHIQNSYVFKRHSQESVIILVPAQLLVVFYVLTVKCCSPLSEAESPPLIGCPRCLLNIFITTIHQKGAGIAQKHSDWIKNRRPRGRNSSPSKCKIFLLSTPSKVVLRSAQPPAQWVSGALSPWVNWPGVKLVTRSRICGSINPLPLIS